MKEKSFIFLFFPILCLIPQSQRPMSAASSTSSSTSIYLEIALGYSFLLLQDDLTVSCHWRGWSFLSIYLIAIYLVKRPCSVFANGWQVLVYFAYPDIQWLTERLFKSARGFRAVHTDILKTPTTGLNKNHSQSTIRQITSLHWTKETTRVIATTQCESLRNNAEDWQKSVY